MRGISWTKLSLFNSSGIFISTEDGVSKLEQETRVSNLLEKWYRLLVDVVTLAEDERSADGDLKE